MKLMRLPKILKMLKWMNRLFRKKVFAPVLAAVCLTAVSALAMPQYTLTDWMRVLPANIPISEINLPGTHDAGTAYIARGTRTMAQCQTWSIPEQLEHGIRLLDIRLRYDEPLLEDKEIAAKRLFVSHGGIVCYKSNNFFNLNFLYFSDVLDYCCEFLDKHKDETIIVYVSPEWMIGGLDTDRYKEATKDKIREAFYYAENGNNPKWQRCVMYNEEKYENIPLLGEVRGKVILVHDIDRNPITPYEHHWESPKEEKWEYVLKALNSCTSSFYYDYHRPAEEQQRYLFRKQSEYEDMKKLGEPYVKEIQTNANVITELDFPSDVAEYVNPRLERYDFKQGVRYGWVSMDFPTDTLIRKIINTNMLYCADLEFRFNWSMLEHPKQMVQQFEDELVLKYFDEGGFVRVLDAEPVVERDADGLPVRAVYTGLRPVLNNGKKVEYFLEWQHQGIRTIKGESTEKTEEPCRKLTQVLSFVSKDTMTHQTRIVFNDDESTRYLRPTPETFFTTFGGLRLRRYVLGPGGDEEGTPVDITNTVSSDEPYCVLEPNEDGVTWDAVIYNLPRQEGTGKYGSRYLYMVEGVTNYPRDTVYQISVKHTEGVELQMYLEFSPTRQADTEMLISVDWFDQNDQYGRRSEAYRALLSGMNIELVGIGEDGTVFSSDWVRLPDDGTIKMPMFRNHQKVRYEIRSIKGIPDYDWRAVTREDEDGTQHIALECMIRMRAVVRILWEKDAGLEADRPEDMIVELYRSVEGETEAEAFSCVFPVSGDAVSDTEWRIWADSDLQPWTPSGKAYRLDYELINPNPDYTRRKKEPIAYTTDENGCPTAVITIKLARGHSQDDPPVVPKTGDPTRPALLAGLLVLSALGICALRKRKA